MFQRQALPVAQAIPELSVFLPPAADTHVSHHAWLPVSCRGSTFPADLGGLWSPLPGGKELCLEVKDKEGEKMSFLNCGPNRNIFLVTQNFQVRTGRLTCVVPESLGYTWQLWPVS